MNKSLTETKTVPTWTLELFAFKAAVVDNDELLVPPPGNLFRDFDKRVFPIRTYRITDNSNGSK